METKEIGLSIKSIRKEIGLKQKDLANKANIAQSYISRIEKGKVDMSISTCSKILSVLNKTLTITGNECNNWT